MSRETREVMVKITQLDTTLQDYLEMFPPNSIHRVRDTGTDYLYSVDGRDYCIYYNEADVITLNNRVGGEIIDD